MERERNAFSPGLRRAVDRLFAERCSCVVCDGERLHVFRERGVADLHRLLTEEPGLLRGAFVADKVVGKGAAALLVLGGVAELYADVASRAALDLLGTAGVRVDCRLVVPHIVNRAGTGICPVERLCADRTTAAECLPRITEFLRTLRAAEGANSLSATEK